MESRRSIWWWMNLYPLKRRGESRTDGRRADREHRYRRATMLRSAAKNSRAVTVVTDPADFERVAREIESAGDTTLPTRLSWREEFSDDFAIRRHDHDELERLSGPLGHVTLSETRVR